MPPSLSVSVGLPVTVTASLKPSVSATLPPTCSMPVPGEAVACVTAGRIVGGVATGACVTVGATFGVVGVVGVIGCVGAVGADAAPVVMFTLLKSAVIVSGAGAR